MRRFLLPLAALPWTLAVAQSADPTERGELLYSTYCSSCHRSDIHWRDKRLATDWDSLTAQVRRWQTNTGLAWETGDTNAIANYLNARFYRFPSGGTVRN